MATFDPNDPDGFFRSAMQELGQPIDDIDHDHEMEEDVFSDAVEHQTRYDGPVDDYKSKLPNNTVASDAYTFESSYLAPSQDAFMSQENTLNYIHQPLQKVQQGYTPFASTRQAHHNSYYEPEPTTKVNTTGASEKYAAAYHNSIKTSFNTSQQAQHASGCDGTRGASTPPATPPPEATQSSQNEVKSEPKSEPKSQPKLQSGNKVWLGPDDLRDVAKAVSREQRWHDKVKLLRPRVHLASHRYWIGVLNPGHKPQNACKEEHFTWMKGNRLTTVETVSKVYAATTMLEGVFMMGGERPEIQDRMEELDLFNDKVVLFQVADEGTPASVGRLITEGLVTKEVEVIELDD
jgi:hypothetical protein